MQEDFTRAATLQAHDHQVAQWLDTVPHRTWERHGDNLERPLDPEHMQSSGQGILTFSGHAEGQTVGFAAVLTNDVGKASQTTQLSHVTHACRKAG